MGNMTTWDELMNPRPVEAAMDKLREAREAYIAAYIGACETVMGAVPRVTAASFDLTANRGEPEPRANMPPMRNHGRSANWTNWVPPVPEVARRAWVVANSDPDEWLGVVRLSEPTPDGMTHAMYETDCDHEDDCECDWRLYAYEG